MQTTDGWARSNATTLWTAKDCSLSVMPLVHSAASLKLPWAPLLVYNPPLALRRTAKFEFC
ncbi:unnamed protein product [Hydatigera taeniaeformis]|uniref:Uncharacterized protein n=1 Tax=Hydatigena taeniaeformis TaxID=6205 RepID=A0A0R3X1M4_HYDTA|nr:unnamed protein product [Hydatigera taeniaeformis]